MGPQEDSKTPTRTSHLVQIEHVQVWTARPFAEVVRGLEAETGVFDGVTIQARIEAKAFKKAMCPESISLYEAPGMESAKARV
jgi:hypothetical protein